MTDLQHLPPVLRAEQLAQRFAAQEIDYPAARSVLLCLAPVAAARGEHRRFVLVMVQVRRLHFRRLAAERRRALAWKRNPRADDEITRWYAALLSEVLPAPDPQLHAAEDAARSRAARARREPHQVMREDVQRQGGSRAAPYITVPQFGPSWMPPAAEHVILNAPAPGTAPPEPGSLALVEALRRAGKPRRAARPSGTRLNDEFEHYVVIGARTPQAAQREYWRHVANRACLAILADHRLPAVPPRPGVPSSTPPSAPPRPVVGGDVFLVQAEAIQLTIGGTLTQTQPLTLEMLVDLERLTVPARLSLQTLREWPCPQTVDPLFKYRRSAVGFERRAGLSGDMVALFEELLKPHAMEILSALGMD